MNKNHGFAHTLLHKSQQGKALRTSHHRYRSDVLQLEYEIKRLMDSPERRPPSSILLKEQSISGLRPVTVSHRSMLTTRSNRRLDTSRGKEARKTTARTASTEPVSSAKAERVKPVLKRSQSQGFIGTRAAQLQTFRSHCSQFQSQISKDLRSVSTLQSFTLRRLRGCDQQIRRTMRQEAVASLPKAFVEFKRKKAAKRARSESLKIEDRPMSMKKEVIEEYHRRAFEKACRNGMSLRMRYVATIGTTKATQLKAVGSGSLSSRAL